MIYEVINLAANEKRAFELAEDAYVFADNICWFARAGGRASASDVYLDYIAPAYPRYLRCGQYFLFGAKSLTRFGTSIFNSARTQVVVGDAFHPGRGYQRMGTETTIAAGATAEIRIELFNNHLRGFSESQWQSGAYMSRLQNEIFETYLPRCSVAMTIEKTAGIGSLNISLPSSGAGLEYRHSVRATGGLWNSMRPNAFHVQPLTYMGQNEKLHIDIDNTNNFAQNAYMLIVRLTNNDTVNSVTILPSVYLMF